MPKLSQGVIREPQRMIYMSVKDSPGVHKSSVESLGGLQALQGSFRANRYLRESLGISMTSYLVVSQCLRYSLNVQGNPDWLTLIPRNSALILIIYSHPSPPLCATHCPRIYRCLKYSLVLFKNCKDSEDMPKIFQEAKSSKEFQKSLYACQSP